MTRARSVAEVLADHVTLEVECIDRMQLRCYVPKLQYETGVVGFFRGHLGHSFASSTTLDDDSPSSKAERTWVASRNDSWMRRTTRG